MDLPYVESLDPEHYAGRSDEVDEDGHYKTPRTFRDLFSARRLMVQALSDADMAPDTYVSCDDCARASKCQWAFDVYNTNGDCLDDK